MKLVAGLGNVGRKYEQTRHNIGFMVVDALSQTLQCSFRMGKGAYSIASGTYKGETLHLLKPLTYMNRSGLAVSQAMRYYDLTPQDCLIIYDDIHLPLGELRLRGKGSAGGHNGISSIIQALQTPEFPRLRVGIGQPEHQALTDYVLAPFSKTEQAELPQIIQVSQDAVFHYVEYGLEKTMSLFNRQHLTTSE
ncbi:MAG: aminoacyl-tRNA hydrolase [Gemmatimonadetes bacterium]|nr:MAG: aminoacyl-tRNA hydrolase [Gemmatimonadota bacterium]